MCYSNVRQHSKLRSKGNLRFHLTHLQQLSRDVTSIMSLEQPKVQCICLPMARNSFKLQKQVPLVYPAQCSWLIFSIPRLYFTNFSDINVTTSDPSRLRPPSSWPTKKRWRNSDDENQRDPTVRWARLTRQSVGGKKTDVWRSYCIIVAYSCNIRL